MNIVVCAKQIPDVRGAISFNEEKQRVSEEGLAYIVNPYDLMAVEEAIRIKERFGGSVTVVTLGDESAKNTIRRCLALGAGRGILLSDPSFAESDNFATASALAKAIAALECDLVLCGNRATGGDFGQVGPLLAEMLGLPAVFGVVDLALQPEQQRAIVQRRLEKGNREEVEVPLPALLTVEVGLNEPRYAGLPTLIAALRSDIQVLNSQALGLSYSQVGSMGSKVKVLREATPRPRPKKVFTPDANLSPWERLRLSYSGGAKEKKSELLEGDPAHIAEEIVKFLQNQGVV